MKKGIILLAASLLLGGAAWAQDTGALGLGIISDSSQENFVGGGGLRGALFLDLGEQLWGPFHYGFELQGDVKRLAQSDFDISSTDVTAFFSRDYYSSQWVYFVQHNHGTLTYTLWDLDLSPRVYVSLDFGNKIQFLAFGGVNFNWQTLDSTIYVDTGSLVAPDGTYLYPGDSWTESQSLGGVWTVLTGVRVNISFFYLDYTRFVQDDSKRDYSWDKYNNDRWGFGLELRF